jgi:tRNA dimethylallyltransferase
MAARLRPSDLQRILRALEVFAATGRSLATFQGARAAPLLDPAKTSCVFLAPERPVLRARIDARFEAMIAAGALEEVRALGERHLDPALPAMRAHGVPGFLAYLRGDMSFADAVAKGKTDTRRYARRQFTFVRNQLGEFEWVDSE